MKNLAAFRSSLANVGGLLLALILMCVLFGSLSRYFFSADTFVTIANDIPATAVSAVGMTFVLIVAGIDLSVGSVMAISAATISTKVMPTADTAVAGMSLAIVTKVSALKK